MKIEKQSFGLLTNYRCLHVPVTLKERRNYKIHKMPIITSNNVRSNIKIYTILLSFNNQTLAQIYVIREDELKFA